MKTYTLHVSGLTRELPICSVSDTLDIAAFIMLGGIFSPNARTLTFC